MPKEELTFDLPRWWAGQPTQKFEVVDGNGSKVLIEAHEVSIGAPQPTLSFVRYEIRSVNVTKTTGGAKNKVETEEVVDHPVMVYSGSFNAGAWISFRDVSVSKILEEDRDKE